MAASDCGHSQEDTDIAFITEAEIGVDGGRELPNIPLVNWAIDKVS
jgi:hypothetical protein